MRVFRWAAVAMTGIVAGWTVWQAANGGGMGSIIVGLAISIFGIFVVALTGDRRYE